MPEMEKLKKADPHYCWILCIEEVSWPFSWLRGQFIKIWPKMSFQDLLLEGKIGYSVSSLPQAFGAIWGWSMTKYLNYGLVPRGQGGARSQILTYWISWTPYSSGAPRGKPATAGAPTLRASASSLTSAPGARGSLWQSSSCCSPSSWCQLSFTPQVGQSKTINFKMDD